MTSIRQSKDKSSQDSHSLVSQKLPPTNNVELEDNGSDRELSEAKEAKSYDTEAFIEQAIKSQKFDQRTEADFRKHALVIASSCGMDEDFNSAQFERRLGDKITQYSHIQATLATIGFDPQCQLKFRKRANAFVATLTPDAIFSKEQFEIDIRGIITLILDEYVQKAIDTSQHPSAPRSSR